MEGITRKLNGGISQIVLIPSRQAVVGWRNNHLYCEQVPSAVIVEPKEDSAKWTERYSRTGGVARVAHSLEFDVAIDNPVLQLFEQAEQGLIAVVEYRNGTKILAGYSPKFALERPLRLEHLTLVSGATRADDAECRLTISSEDEAFALPVILS